MFYAAALALAGAALLQPRAAQAQAFNCRLARLPAEVAICQNGLLSELDVAMTGFYYRLINGGVGPQLARSIAAGQAAWLRSRNACGYDVRCLVLRYRQRIAQLRSY
jgi:uncharacterized protein